MGYATTFSIDQTFLSLRPPSRTRHWRYAIVDIVRRLLLTSTLLALGVFGLRIVYIWALMISFLFVTVTREQGQYWDASSDVLAYVLGQFVMVSPIRTTCASFRALSNNSAHASTYALTARFTRHRHPPFGVPPRPTDLRCGVARSGSFTAPRGGTAGG